MYYNLHNSVQTCRAAGIMNTYCTLFFLILLETVRAIPFPQEKVNQTFWNQNRAIEKFREYLRIDTSNPENLKQAVEFWRREALESGLEFAVYEPAGKPICVITWRGTDPTLPSIMLNTHMDVVPAKPEDWTYPPFEAHMDEHGDIYARGTQDTKDITLQQIEAIRRLKSANVSLPRTFHITIIPDEETGSFQGMIPFLKTQPFRNLNVGFALDEGLVSSSNNTLIATYVDKRPWQMKFTVYGTAGHGSLMPEDSAAEKLERLIKAISSYRETQKCLQQSGELYNNLNINVIQGGLATNIVPSQMSITVDMRLSVTENTTALNEIVESWMDAAGNDTKVEFIRHINDSIATPIHGSPFWTAIKEATSQFGLKVTPKILSATSDMIYLRKLGIPALGFTPNLNTISRIHGANEYLNNATFIKGIDIYYEVIKKLGNRLPLEQKKDVSKEDLKRNEDLMLSEITNSKRNAQNKCNSKYEKSFIKSKASTVVINRAHNALIVLLGVNIGSIITIF